MAVNNKLEKCVGLLEKIKDQPGDIMECAAICILDLQEVLNSIEKQDLAEYRKQRKDCLKTMKAFYKLVKKVRYTIK